MAEPRGVNGHLGPSLVATSVLLALGLAPAAGVPGRVREALRNDLPSRADFDRMERGYYERLTDAARSPAGPAPGGGDAALPGHAETVKVEHGRLTRSVDDVREFVLREDLSEDPGRRIPWSTNAWGMRDRAYAPARPPGVFRVALVGDSIAAGWGVDDVSGFEPRLERAWDDRARAGGWGKVEVLNFAVPGHGPGQRWTHFSTVGWAFDPDLVVFEATPADTGWDERRLRAGLARGVGFDAAVYRDVLARAGVRPGLDADGYKGRLKPLREALLEGVYRAAVGECRSRGVPVVLVLIPRVGKAGDPGEARDLLALARRSGFDAVVDATGVFDGLDPRDLAVGPDDFHPNADGHARIARALDAALGDRVGPAHARRPVHEQSLTKGAGPR